MLDRQMILMIAIMVLTAIYDTGGRTLKRKKVYIGIVTAVLTLFSGLRSWWMGDLIKYYTLYLNCNGGDWKSVVFEKWQNAGIRIFFHLAGKCGISYDVCLFLIAAFVAVTLGVLVYRHSRSPYLSYLMYIGMGFYIFTYSGLKQAIGMGFCILAMLALLDGKPVRFLIWTLIGAVFHAPALVFLLAYPFSKRKIDSWYFGILLVMLALLFALRNAIANWLGQLYYEEETEFVANELVGGRFVMMILILALGIWLRPPRSFDKKYSKVFNIIVIAAAIQTFSVFDNNFTRLADYYYQFVVLFIPMILTPGAELAKEFPENRDRIRYQPQWLLNTLVIGITAFAVWYYSGYIQNALDFKFIWELDPYSLYGK